MNSTITIEQQLEEMNRKLDMLMEEMSHQRRRRQEMEDLMQDLSVIGKDVFETTVAKLDKAGIELDYDQLANFWLKLIRNIETFNRFLEMMESVDDLLKDVAPILHQAGLDAIQKLHQLESKGYFTFAREIGAMADRIVTNFSAQELRELSDNIITILDILKNLARPEVLKPLNNALVVYRNMDTANVPHYSIWKVLRELNSPEMKKTLGFLMTFMKNLAKEQNMRN